MFTLLYQIVILGVVYWLLTLLQLREPFPSVIRVVVVLALIYLVLSFAGLLPASMPPLRP